MNVMPASTIGRNPIEAKADEPAGTGTGVAPAASSEVIPLAVAYNDALNHCTQTGGANIDEMYLHPTRAERLRAAGFKNPKSQRGEVSAVLAPGAVSGVIVAEAGRAGLRRVDGLP